jgi:membrane protein YqaA with SNARE-associated domain
VALQAATFSSISSEAMGRASALFSSVRQVAGAVGVAFLATVLISRTGVYLGTGLDATALTMTAAAGREAVLHAFHDAFAAAGLLGLFGLLAAWLIRDEDAAESMHRVTAEPLQQPDQAVLVPAARA